MNYFLKVNVILLYVRQTHYFTIQPNECYSAIKVQTI